MAADPEVGRVLDECAVERDTQGALHELAGFQRDERVPAEEPGAYGCPLGYPGRVVEVHLVHGSDLDALAVERLAADQAARIDVGLHGPSTGRGLLHKHYGNAQSRRRPLENSAGNAAGRLVTAADPARESLRKAFRRRRRSKSSPESLRHPYRTDEVTLESRAGSARPGAGSVPFLTDGESRCAAGYAGEALRLR